MYEDNNVYKVNFYDKHFKANSFDVKFMYEI